MTKGSAKRLLVEVRRQQPVEGVMTGPTGKRREAYNRKGKNHILIFYQRGKTHFCVIGCGPHPPP
jgi:hypothetical protein